MLTLPVMRTRYLFAPHPKPFLSLLDVVSDLDPQLRNTFGSHSSLAHAVQLTNLARFIYAIMQPDDAGHLAAGLDTPDADEEKPNLENGQHGKSKARGKAQEEEAARLLYIERRRKVRRRNLILLAVWKRYWDTIVPKNMRSNESAIRLWLDLATQVSPNSARKQRRIVSSQDDD
jgi:hypothetical protein